MVELAGIPPFGGGGVNTRPVSDTAAAAVPAVEASVKGQGLSGHSSSNQSHSDQHGKNLDGQAASQPAPRVGAGAPDPDALTGPPPSFQVSVLEMDRNLAQTLARINAAHAIESDAKAIAGPSPDETAAPEQSAADMSGGTGPADHTELADAAVTGQPDAA